MKTAVIVFPGSNCDRDMAVALETVTGRAPAMVWHRETELPDGVERESRLFERGRCRRQIDMGGVTEPSPTSCGTGPRGSRRGIARGVPRDHARCR